MTLRRASTSALRATADKSLAQGRARLRSYAATARQARRIFQSRLFTTAATVLMTGSTSVLACPVCFGAEETSMIDGAKLGVLVMLAILFAVQGGFVGFFLYLRRRAKRIADIELDDEWSELQRSPRTS
jgi:MFS-type transporter involved in bile tolerance (Atg22 family)